MTIRWSYKAQKQQDKAADYIYVEFGERAVNEFYNKIDKIEKDLLEFPELGKVEALLAGRKKVYRSLPVNRLSKLIYSVESDHIRIHALWNTRCEPNKQASQT